MVMMNTGMIMLMVMMNTVFYGDGYDDYGGDYGDEKPFGRQRRAGDGINAKIEKEENG